MSITIGQLLAVPELKLRLVHDGGCNGTESIVWVHATDVVNAAEFAEPGEVLLTCSTNFPLEDMSNANDLSLLRRDRHKLGLSSSFKDAESAKEAYDELWMHYVSSLSRAGVMAIGFGVKMKHPVIPQACIDAVKQHNMLLFEVPEEVNFSQIAKTVIRSQAEESENVQRVMYSAQRELFEASNDRNPIEAVVNRAALLSSGWAAFIDTEMRIISISNQSMRKRAMLLAVRMRKQKERDGDAAKTLFGVASGAIRYCVCLIGQKGQTFGMLVVSTSRSGSYGDIFRSLGVAAADALMWSLPQHIERFRSESRLRAIAMGELQAGRAQSAASIMGPLWKWTPSYPARLYCVEPFGVSNDMDFATMSIESACPDSVFGEYEDRLWILTSKDGCDAVERWIEGSGALDSGYAAVRGPRSFPSAFNKAVQNLLLHRAGSRDSVLDITPHELVDPDLAQMYAEELFAPLKDVPAAENHSLMATLRELMYASFNIGTAASRLKVHRHTVENRVVKLERLLGLDFADESARVRLWIAYSFIRDAEQA
jgi:hypothetical protein